MRLSVRSWQNGFENPRGIAVVFDVFRCTTTVHCLHSRNPKEIYVGKSLAELRERDQALVKNWRIFSELSQPIDCLERFDNSPEKALAHSLRPGDTALVATTTGTPAMFAARGFEKVYLGTLVNFSALVRALSRYDGPITLIPAAIPDWQHVEDELTAVAVATALEGYSDMPEFVHACAMQARDKIIASGRVELLTKKLPTGARDTEIALSVDKFPFVLACDFAAAESPLLAKVQESA